MTPDDEPRHWTQDLDEDGNVMDLLGSIHRGEMVAIVSEDAGGIIAYALGDDFARHITAALETVRQGGAR